MSTAQGAKQAGGKKAFAASGGAGALPLGPSNAANAAGGGDAAGGKAIEQIYQKKTQLEHILLRPDTYIGSTEKQQQQLWVHDGERMVCRPTSYVPGLYKIFDEILVNAADNKVRDPSMDTLRVTIDSVRRGGRTHLSRRGPAHSEQQSLQDTHTVSQMVGGPLAVRAARRRATSSRCGTTATASPSRCTRRRACTCPSSSLATCSPAPTTTTTRKRRAAGQLRAGLCARP